MLENAHFFYPFKHKDTCRDSGAEYSHVVGVARQESPGKVAYCWAREEMLVVPNPSQRACVNMSLG